MITTNRLNLAPISLADSDFVYELLNTKEWIENIGDRNVSSVEQASQYIQDKMINHYEKHGYGNYLMTRKSDGAKIGCISLLNREDVEGVDIGFALLPDYFSQGYASEGATAIQSFAKESLGFTSICAFTTKENIASQKLIKKLGLTFRKTILFGEEKEELLYFLQEF